MHAVVFEVAIKPGIDPAVADAELGKMIEQVKTLPGFIRGIWATDGTTGLSFQLYADENVARQLVGNATVPPAQRSSSAPPGYSQSSATPPSPPDIPAGPAHWRDRKPRDQRYRWSRMEEDDHASAPDPAVRGQECLGSRAHLCDEPAHRAPNWKFCKFKRGEPSATFGAPDSAFGLPAIARGTSAGLTLRSEARSHGWRSGQKAAGAGLLARDPGLGRSEP